MSRWQSSATWSVLPVSEKPALRVGSSKLQLSSLPEPYRHMYETLAQRRDVDRGVKVTIEVEVAQMSFRRGLWSKYLAKSFPLMARGAVRLLSMHATSVAYERKNGQCGARSTPSTATGCSLRRQAKSSSFEGTRTSWPSLMRRAMRSTPSQHLSRFTPKVHACVAHADVHARMRSAIVSINPGEYWFLNHAEM
eukprot:363789-Chlamydomonas_euryale.AAC.13